MTGKPPRAGTGFLIRPATPAWAFIVIGGTLITLYALGPMSLAVPLFLLIPVCSGAAVIVGLRRNQAPGRRRPWYAFALALACFFGAAILRITVPGATATPPGPAAFIPDLLVVPGYLLFGYGISEILRRRRATEDDSAHADAVLIGIAAALVTWVFFLAPHIGAEQPASLPEWLASTFPCVDVLLLAIMSRLLLADGVRKPALWLVAASTAAMFTIDLIYAVREGGLAGGGPALMVLFDVLFLAGNVTLGAAALHPSAGSLADPQQVRCRAFGPARTIGISAVVIAPTVLTYLVPTHRLWNVIVRTALAILLSVAVIVRIIRAHDSQAKAEQAALHRLTHDPLTELPNRELLTTVLRGWYAEGRAICLLFLDLDRFKHVNDSWGHAVGDELLRAVAGRLAGALRGSDQVFRTGGDEFVVALVDQMSAVPPALSAPAAQAAASAAAAPAEPSVLSVPPLPPVPPTAEPLAHRLLQVFAKPFALSVGEIAITPSIGVARSSGTTDALDLIRDADIAMYQAKGSGRNRYAVFDLSLRDKLSSRTVLEQELRGALGRGELSVHYQPIVDLADDELSGFEALMRWNHPRLGAISPIEFIPIAEETGLIVASGAWLLAEAVDQLARWQRDRPPGLPQLHVSVNISVRQLGDSALVDVVRGALAGTDLPASALWLEITESVLLKDPVTALSTLHELRDLGVVVCIDDFGTGYASLSYVRQLPAGIVKIDKSFTDGIGSRADDEAIIRAVIAMAHSIGQQVVAEGVETVAQRDWLRSQGCELVQGWLYGAPRKAAAQPAWRERFLRPTRPQPDQPAVAA